MSDEADSVNPSPIHPHCLMFFAKMSREPGTGFKHFHEILETIYLDRFPDRISFGVYTSFSSARTGIAAIFKLVDSDGEVIHLTPTLSLQPVEDPNIDQSLATTFGDVKIQKPGHYFVQLWVNDVYITDRRLVIKSLG